MESPLFKVPLLLGLSLWTYRGMSPPLRPPRSNERARAAIPDFLTVGSNVQRVAIGTAKVIFCTFAAVEAASIVVQQTPLVLDTLSSTLPTVAASTVALSLKLTPISLAGGLLGIAGGCIRVWCHQTLGRFFTWEVAVRDGHRLVTDGPYSIVRHPSYTGWYLVIIGNLLAMLSRRSLFTETGLGRTFVGKAIATYVTVYMGYVCAGMLYRTKTEDEMLKKEFGAEWEDWAKKTPYRLIPFVY
ncbi:ICMT-domain-containing protein [Polyporus arcularius HHB13444]|uniref:Protein-S-isoprenylcysteine O-methyltransferase n=1 Tax=Polyporus arcularius HHB13444 TaxID=1314778 RepID=A0A5C3P8L9_9APHY|nr:ICMT-domain-containing protein [Polyporus arcularius HHB13444]